MLASETTILEILEIVKAQFSCRQVVMNKDCDANSLMASA